MKGPVMAPPPRSGCRFVHEIFHVPLTASAPHRRRPRFLGSNAAVHSSRPSAGSSLRAGDFSGACSPPPLSSASCVVMFHVRFGTPCDAPRVATQEMTVAKAAGEQTAGGYEVPHLELIRERCRKPSRCRRLAHRMDRSRCARSLMHRWVAGLRPRPVAVSRSHPSLI